MARLLMNFVLLRSDFPIVTIPATHQEEYLARLKDADMGDLRPFVRFVLKCAGDSLQVRFLIDASDLTFRRAVGLYCTRIDQATYFSFWSKS